MKKSKANWLSAFPDQAIKSRGNAPKKPKARKRIRPVSKRRQAVLEQYNRLAKTFVAARRAVGERCPVVTSVESLRGQDATLTEVHHVRGRNSTLLLDSRHWLAVSKAGHRFIHDNPVAARVMGFLCPYGLWNVPDRTPFNPCDAETESKYRAMCNSLYRKKRVARKSS